LPISLTEQPALPRCDLDVRIKGKPEVRTNLDLPLLQRFQSYVSLAHAVQHSQSALQRSVDKAFSAVLQNAPPMAAPQRKRPF
jgi:hypothetical protein